MFIFPNKTTVEIIKFEKGLYPFNNCRDLLDYNYYDFLGIYFNTIGTNNKSKIFYPFYIKFVLLNIDLKAYLLKALNNFLYIYNILKFIFRVNQDIIEINYNKIIEVIKKNIINIILKNY